MAGGSAGAILYFTDEDGLTHKVTPDDPLPVTGGGGGGGGDASAANQELIIDALEKLAPATAAAAVTPSDSVNLGTASRAIYVGTGGNISLQIGGTAVIHKNVPSGTRLDVVATRVNATGTTATDIVSWS